MRIVNNYSEYITVYSYNKFDFYTIIIKLIKWSVEERVETRFCCCCYCIGI